ncbi:hypothetical protein [Streptococcus suis]|uniref:hypothetical protein n=1 Tax=Streptococcus suis TaxID=1307 RepID=UPI000462762D|nr:hypothetical protein [Streptococcus suis]MDS1159994.1 hypothetical protein [Streptococcus suis]QDS24653.1 hypothetical protein FPT06_10490 [Streptococcus suis]HEL2507184.1 hypothetical protein [Streptococcus suis]HEL2532936.1 hypothetical protein [Streptococcus suis]HEL2719848.1 hypothetical protein [Streptococcus suis]
MKIVKVKLFKERRSGDLETSVVNLNVPGRCRPASVVKNYIERINKNRLTKIYWYEILEVII